MACSLRGPFVRDRIARQPRLSLSTARLSSDQAGGMDETARTSDPNTFQPQVGADVLTLEGERIGGVAAVTEAHMKVDAPHAKDFWLAKATIQSLDSAAVRLSFGASQLDGFKLSEPGALADSPILDAELNTFPSAAAEAHKREEMTAGYERVHTTADSDAAAGDVPLEFSAFESDGDWEAGPVAPDTSKPWRNWSLALGVAAAVVLALVFSARRGKRREGGQQSPAARRSPTLDRDSDRDIEELVRRKPSGRVRRKKLGADASA